MADRPINAGTNSFFICVCSVSSIRCGVESQGPWWRRTCGVRPLRKGASQGSQRSPFRTRSAWPQKERRPPRQRLSRPVESWIIYWNLEIMPAMTATTVNRRRRKCKLEERIMRIAQGAVAAACIAFDVPSRQPAQRPWERQTQWWLPRTPQRDARARRRERLRRHDRQPVPPSERQGEPRRGQSHARRTRQCAPSSPSSLHAPTREQLRALRAVDRLSDAFPRSNAAHAPRSPPPRGPVTCGPSPQSRLACLTFIGLTLSPWPWHGRIHAITQSETGAETSRRDGGSFAFNRRRSSKWVPLAVISHPRFAGRRIE